MTTADRAQVSAVLRHFKVAESPEDVIKLADYPKQALKVYRTIYASFTDDERRELQ